jgi:hypothetical protein
MLMLHDIEALFGNSAAARHQAADALSFGEQPTAFVALAAGDSTPSALALALAGDPVLATNVAERLASQTPPGGFANKVWLPEVRAAIEIDRGNPMRALELLAPVTPLRPAGSTVFWPLT